jgi:hypothetical protein
LSPLSTIEKLPDIDVAIGPAVSSDAIAEQVDGWTRGAGMIQSARISACAHDAAFSEKSPWTHGARGEVLKLRIQQDETAQSDICPEVFQTGALNQAATFHSIKPIA